MSDLNTQTIESQESQNTMEPTEVRSALDYETLYLESKEENKRLSAILDAARISGTPNPNQTAKPVVTAARVKAAVGQVGFLKMTRDAKLKALGIDPASITDEGLRKLFGRRADPSLGADLMKSNPGRYRLLREAALLTNAYGA